MCQRSVQTSDSVVGKKHEPASHKVDFNPHSRVSPTGRKVMLYCEPN